MKFKVTMKCPDALYEAINEAVSDFVHGVSALEPLDDEERELIVEARQAKVRELCQRWFEYGEYLTVEVDTKQMTCQVVAVQ